MHPGTGTDDQQLQRPIYRVLILRSLRAGHRDRNGELDRLYYDLTSVRAGGTCNMIA